jgi:hypothetical protein
MTSLPSHLYSDCQAVLTKCSVFESQSNLKSVFFITELAPFKDALPETQSKQERVNQTIGFLISYPVSKAKNNLLLLFLRALAMRCNEEDQLREELLDLRQSIANWLNEYSVIEIPIVSLAMTRGEAEKVINGAVFSDISVPPVAGNKFNMLCDLLKEHGVTDLLALYGERREDWKIEYQSPNGNLFATVEKVVTDAMNYINERCRTPKRLAPLRPRFESAAFFDSSTRTETWYQLQECGCVVVADAVSLFHPKLSRAFLQSTFASNDRVAIFIHSPINFRSMRINSFLEEQVNSEIEFAFQRFDKRLDKLCELGIGGARALRRWLNAIVPDIEEFVRRERPQESKCELMRELAPKNDVGRFFIRR